ncbi:CLUMA_CG020317, isoform A [Clunio marinus]|uniref:CLUMA_CG020317, isoform A n=1 Tax=Clunio marinus TaxID=568069 RepID=A0A1J1J5R7_9DIPT|nr:CLUMA_CG020317, isoform A [Clunio marinus]
MDFLPYTDNNLEQQIIHNYVIVRPLEILSSYCLCPRHGFVSHHTRAKTDVRVISLIPYLRGSDFEKNPRKIS